MIWHEIIMRIFWFFGLSYYWRTPSRPSYYEGKVL